MFRPLSLYIGLRYLRSKRSNHFISFITSISILGIALGVMVLVTVLSIMNGFDQVVKEKIFDISQHITIQNIHNQTTKTDWPVLRKALLQKPHVLGAAPFLASQGLVVYQHHSQPTAIYGIVPEIEHDVSSLSDKITLGQFNLIPNQNGIILGEQLAQTLGATLGDKINLYLPVMNKSLLGLTPRTQECIVMGTFRTGKGVGLDNMFAYLHLNDLQTLYQSKEMITGIRVKLNDLYEAPHLAEQLSKSLPAHYIVSDWTFQYGNLISAIALEKTITLWILLLLVAIATFNLLSSLVMLVTEKKSEIAILKTLGMSTTTLLNTFIIQGSLIGLMGTLLGLGMGFFLSQHISALAHLLEQWFHFKLFPATLFIERLPSQIQIIDFIQVGLASLAMSIIATIYPAWRASRTIPIETLRYE